MTCRYIPGTFPDFTDMLLLSSITASLKQCLTMLSGVFTVEKDS